MRGKSTSRDPTKMSNTRIQEPRGTCTLGKRQMKEQIRLPKCLNFVAGAANFQAGQKAGRTRLQKLQQVVQAVAPRRRSRGSTS